MSSHSPTATKWLGGAMSLVAIAVAAVLMLGCTPESKYKTLSFFFDGVPDPNAPQVNRGNVRGTPSKPLYIHQPYAEEKCNACHLNTEDIFARAKVRANVCMDCHAPIKTAHKVMHGPVVNDACNYCHVPHTSPNEHLLKVPSPKICMQCHETASLTTSTPEHLDPKASCLSCHSGHGGADHSMIRVLRPLAAAATTAPAGNGGVK